MQLSPSCVNEEENARSNALQLLLPASPHTPRLEPIELEVEQLPSPPETVVEGTPYTLPIRVVEQIERLKLLAEINRSPSPSDLISMEIMPWTKPMMPLFKDPRKELKEGYTIEVVRQKFPGEVELFKKAESTFPNDELRCDLMFEITRNWGEDALIIPEDEQGRPSDLWVFNGVVTEAKGLAKYYAPRHWWIRWFDGDNEVDMEISDDEDSATTKKEEAKVREKHWTEETVWDWPETQETEEEAAQWLGRPEDVVCERCHIKRSNQPANFDLDTYKSTWWHWSYCFGWHHAQPEQCTACGLTKFNDEHDCFAKNKKCYYCKKVGHLQENCAVLIRNRAREAHNLITEAALRIKIDMRRRKYVGLGGLRQITRILDQLNQMHPDQLEDADKPYGMAEGDDWLPYLNNGNNSTTRRDYRRHW
jgi:hypothetical protein